MTFLTLEYIKQHSRICHNAEDAELTRMATAAEETICGLLNRGDTVADMVESLTEQYSGVPAAIIEAGLELVDHWYHYRSPAEGQSLSTTPYSFDVKIKRYMIL